MFGEVAERAGSYVIAPSGLQRQPGQTRSLIFLTEALPRKFGEVAERLKAAHC